jgi:hypothetical protein
LLVRGVDECSGRVFLKGVGRQSVWRPEIDSVRCVDDVRCVCRQLRNNATKPVFVEQLSWEFAGFAGFAEISSRFADLTDARGRKGKVQHSTAQRWWTMRATDWQRLWGAGIWEQGI